MLLNMIVHQPQALIQVVTHTPYWVWGLLAALVGLGASQLYDRTASLRRTQLMRTFSPQANASAWHTAAGRIAG